ncbi:hypothetical protein BH683_018500 [Williamsia sp. 1138]|nr:hypothetical protein BH683_018500 [Williamsia sp. 1138]
MAGGGAGGGGGGCGVVVDGAADVVGELGAGEFSVPSSDEQPTMTIAIAATSTPIRLMFSFLAGNDARYG